MFSPWALQFLAVVAVTHSVNGAVTREVTLKLGSDHVPVTIHEQGSAQPLLVCLHANEQSAVRSGLTVLRERGGRLVKFRRHRERWLRFSLGPGLFQVDPNRMFTRAGVTAWLQKGGRSSPAAVQAVEHFAQQWRDAVGLDAARVVIALHNNSPGPPLSVKSYLAPEPLAAEAQRVHVNPQANPDDFILVTRRAHYEALQARGFNVVLQADPPATDDGSLSVFCARRGMAYANVEAREGHQREQEEMLRAVMDVMSAPAR